jgi:UDP-4-amino-4,6-dideoxy-N-acetyl-beta-L-altrosamine transaminase
MKFIPYGRQSISEQDIEAVIKVLRSDWLTQGPDIKDFEEAVAKYSDAQYGVAVMNATAALHIACLALGVEKGDLVWTSPNTFLASANCALYCGAEVDFVDIDPKTYNMSAKALTEKLEAAKKQNKLPKVVIPVHFAGQSCDMKAIKKLADQYGFKIIEDASHAIGARYDNQPVGNCLYSDISIFSFHPVKIMTTAEGGMLLTNQKQIADKLKLLRSHGMTKDQALMTKPSEGHWYYEQIDLGFNYRITDIQCALGLSQLQRVDEFVANRNELARYYHQKLEKLPLVLPVVEQPCYSSYHLYVVQIDPAKTNKGRLEVFKSLQQANIGVNVHYMPVYLQPYYQQQFGFKAGYCPHAEHYYAHAISLPLYFDLKPEEQSYVVEKLVGALL